MSFVQFVHTVVTFSSFLLKKLYRIDLRSIKRKCCIYNQLSIARPVEVEKPKREFFGSMMDMKGRVYFTPLNNLTEELIRKVEIAIQIFSEESLYVFGKMRRSDVGKIVLSLGHFYHQFN
jgi:hypothetical protein